VKRLVEVIEDLEALKNHANYCRDILYKIEETTKGYRIRIRAGRFGWDGEVSKEKLDDIIAWLRSVSAVKVKGSVSDESFFI